MITFFVACVALFEAWRKREENDDLRTIVTESLSTNEEIRKTLAMGLFYRFKKEDDVKEKQKIISEIFLKQDPYEFETFVATVMKNYYGGSTYVTPSSGDCGIDIEHTRKEGLFLGQVKCYEKDLDFVPIAIIHSQIMKENAQGGFVVTTGSFSTKAKEYAKNLNIELIDGLKLVEFWEKGMDKQNHLIERQPDPKAVTS